jgi:hypothetical protein
VEVPCRGRRAPDKGARPIIEREECVRATQDLSRGLDAQSGREEVANALSRDPVPIIERIEGRGEDGLLPGSPPGDDVERGGSSRDGDLRRAQDMGRRVAQGHDHDAEASAGDPAREASLDLAEERLRSHEHQDGGSDGAALARQTADVLDEGGGDGRGAPADDDVTSFGFPCHGAPLPTR